MAFFRSFEKGIIEALRWLRAGQQALEPVLGDGGLHPGLGRHELGGQAVRLQETVGVVLGNEGTEAGGFAEGLTKAGFPGKAVPGAGAPGRQAGGGLNASELSSSEPIPDFLVVHYRKIPELSGTVKLQGSMYRGSMNSVVAPDRPLMVSIWTAS